MKKIALMVIAWIIIINIFGIISLYRLNLSPDTAYTWINPVHFKQNQSLGLIGMHGNWDGEWYKDIAKNGYSYKQNHLSNVAFFPLYPLLVRMLSNLTFGNFILAGWIISILSLLFSSLYIYKIVRKFHSQVDPYTVIGLMLIFPTAFFLNAVYTESLYLFLSVAGFYYLLEKRYLVAGIFGFFAVITRSTGILLLIPFFYQAYQDIPERWILLRKTVPFLFLPLGLIAFFTYDLISFHNFWLFFKIENIWGRTFIPNLYLFQYTSPAAAVNLCLDLFFIIFVLLILIFNSKQLKTSYKIYLVLGLAIPLLTGTTMSIGRYILPLFPLFISLASIRDRFILYGWTLISILMLALYTTLFVNNYWAG